MRLSSAVRAALLTLALVAGPSAARRRRGARDAHHLQGGLVRRRFRRTAAS